MLFPSAGLKFSSKKLAVLSLVSLSVFILNACQNQPTSAVGTSLPSALTTAQGVKAETLVPQDTFMVIKIGTDDAGQIDHVNKLAQYFPQESQNQLIQNFMTVVDENLSTYQMTYKDDVQPFIGDHPQALLAYTAATTANQQQSSKIQSPTQNNLNMTMVISLQNVDKADAFLQKISSKNEYKKDTYNGNSYYYNGQPGSPYIVRLKDALLLTDKLDVLKSAIDHLNNPAGSFIENKNYQKALAKVPTSLGFAYFDFQNMLKLYNNIPELKAQMSQMMTTNASMLQGIQGEVFSLSAEDKGFRIHGNIFGDEQILKNAEINFLSTPPQDAYLYKKLPAQNAIVYLEGYNLQKGLDIAFKAWDQSAQFKNFHNEIQQFFAAQGLDFDKDIMTILDKGIAFSFNNNGPLPGIGLYVDTSSNPDAAKKVVAKIDDALHKLLDQAKTQSPEIAAALTSEEKDLQGTKVHVINFDPSKLKDTTIPSQLGDLKGQLWYGTTPDKITFVTLMSDFDKVFGTKNLDQDENFKAVQQQLSGPLKGFIYISPSSLANYLDVISSLDPSAKTPEYDLLIGYLKPLKGAIFTTKNVTTSEVEMEGFVLVTK